MIGFLYGKQLFEDTKAITKALYVAALLQELGDGILVGSTIPTYTKIPILAAQIQPNETRRGFRRKPGWR